MHNIVVAKSTESSLSVGRCPRCKEINPETSSYCGKCGLPLRDSVKAKIEADIAEVDLELIKAALEDPALLEEIAKRVNKTP